MEQRPREWPLLGRGHAKSPTPDYTLIPSLHVRCLAGYDKYSNQNSRIQKRKTQAQLLLFGDTEHVTVGGVGTFSAAIKNQELTFLRWMFLSMSYCCMASTCEMPFRKHKTVFIGYSE
jgi:hypothetical protein